MSQKITKGRWLFKEEPNHYSFEQLLKDGSARWDGVENNAALKNLRSVKKNDEILFYHTGEEKRVVGLMRASSDAYADPNDKTGRLVVVDVKPVRALPKAVTLSEMKTNTEFAGFELLRLPRLSVMPVPEKFWTLIMRISGA